MKKFLLVILAMMLVQRMFAQARIFDLSDSTADRPSVAELDANFRSAVHSDSALAVFKSDTDRELLITTYQTFLNKMSKYLTDHGFKWEQPTRIFNRFYMNPDGTIEYYIYKVLGKDAAVTEANKEKFESLVASFLKDNTFGLTAPVPFAQCSPVVFK